MATTTVKPSATNFDPSNPGVYQSPDLPQVQHPIDTPVTSIRNTPPPKQPTIGPGALGSASYIADNVMHGIANGIAQGRISRAEKLARQQKALQSNYNLAAKNFAEVAEAQNVTPQQMQKFQQAANAIYADPSKPGPHISHGQVEVMRKSGFAGMSPEQTSALLDASGPLYGGWQSYTKWLQPHIEQGKKKKTKRGPSTDSDPVRSPDDAGNHGPGGIRGVIQRIHAAMQGNDPAAVTQEIYNFWSQNGPPVYGQLSSSLAQSQQRATEQKSQLEASQLQEKALGLQTDMLDAHAKGDTERAEKDKQALEDLYQATHPVRTPHLVNIASDKDPNHVLTIDANTEGVPPGYHLAGVMHAGPPKPLKYDPTTDRVLDLNTGKQYSRTDKDLPPEIKSVFDGVKRAMQNKAVTTAGVHTVMVWNGTQEVPVQVETTTTRTPAGIGATSPAPAANAGQQTGTGAPKHAAAGHGSNAGIVNVGEPVGYKPSPETTTMQKQAANANASYQGMVSSFNEARKNAQDALHDPTDGVAKVNLVATFLKSMGAHSASQTGSQVRLTQAEWNMVQQSAPLTQRILSHFATTQNGTVILSGLTLSPQQMVEMVKSLKEKADAMKGDWQSLEQQAQSAQESDKKSMGGPHTAHATPTFDWNAHPVAQ